jgi:hypothetical protein
VLSMRRLTMRRRGWILPGLATRGALVGRAGPAAAPGQIVSSAAAGTARLHLLRADAT